jgi:hypothetical protein
MNPSAAVTISDPETIPGPMEVAPVEVLAQFDPLFQNQNIPAEPLFPKRSSETRDAPKTSKAGRYRETPRSLLKTNPKDIKALHRMPPEGKKGRPAPLFPRIAYKGHLNETHFISVSETDVRIKDRGKALDPEQAPPALTAAPPPDAMEEDDSNFVDDSYPDDYSSNSDYEDPDYWRKNKNRKKTAKECTEQCIPLGRLPTHPVSFRQLDIFFHNPSLQLGLSSVKMQWAHNDRMHRLYEVEKPRQNCYLSDTTIRALHRRLDDRNSRTGK